MREILGIALVLAVAFIFVTVTALSLALSKTVNTATDATKSQIHSGMVIHDLHVSLPSDMKNFPVELVPLP